MKPSISIIVPFYNAQKYLKKCIESILNQTFEDFELLLINDGSNDKSGIICDKFALQDERIKVFHQENSGVSSARNVGLKEAKGEWIGFVDSDDWCDKHMFEKMYEKIKTPEVEAIVCGFNEVTNHAISTKKIDTKSGVLNQKEAILSLLGVDGFGGYSWNKLIKSSPIKKYDLKFDTNIHHKEDLYFFYTVFLRIKSIYFFPEAFYNYNITEKKIAIKKRELTFFYATQKIIRTDKREDVIHKAKISEVSSAIGSYVVCLNNGYEKRVREYFKKRVDKYKHIYYKDVSVPLRHKLYAFLTSYPRVFRFIFRAKTEILKVIKR